MKKYTRFFLSVLAFSTVSSAAAIAQTSGGSPIELGIDAQLAFRSVDLGGRSTTETLFSLPASQIRAGFFLSPMLELEPALGVNYISGDGGHTTNANFVVGLPINLQTNFAQPNWFVRPFVGFERLTASISNGDDIDRNQVNFGVGLGVRVPIDRRFSGRFEANFTHGNHQDGLLAYNQFGLLAGLSFFTR